jgi:hypothetical protein
MLQWHKGPNLGSKGNVSEALRQTIDLEVVKLAAGSSYRLGKEILRHCGAADHRQSEGKATKSLRTGALRTPTTFGNFAWTDLKNKIPMRL